MQEKTSVPITTLFAPLHIFEFTGFIESKPDFIYWHILHCQAYIRSDQTILYLRSHVFLSVKILQMC